MQVSRQVCRGLLANIIFTGQMFSAGGKRNNKYAGTPHFHDWSVASTKSTALFRVCTHILPAWSVAEGHPGSMQKCVCVCRGHMARPQLASALIQKMPPPPGSTPMVPQLEVMNPFGTYSFPPSFLGGLAKRVKQA